MKEKIENLQIGKVLFNIDVKNYTTYKVSANVFCLVIPDTLEHLITLINFLQQENMKYKILGKGSNLLFFHDYDGVLISLEAFNSFQILEDKIIVGAGASLMKVSLDLSNQGFTGLEWATGIPGTMGGAIVQNAGCYGSEIAEFVESVKVLTPKGNVEEWSKDKLQFSYRHSIFKDNSNYIILKVNLKPLAKGNIEEIQELIKTRREKRMSSQPLEYPSAGSVFRNTNEKSAWEYVEGIGYKGKKIGGAEVSSKHANFIINSGNATGEDIKNLIEEIKEKVKEKYNVELICEQEFVE